MQFTSTRISIFALSTFATLAAGYGLSRGQSVQADANTAPADSGKPQTDLNPAPIAPNLLPTLAQPEIFSPQPLAKLPSIAAIPGPGALPTLPGPVATPEIDRLSAANSVALPAAPRINPPSQPGSISVNRLPIDALVAASMQSSVPNPAPSSPPPVTPQAIAPTAPATPITLKPQPQTPIPANPLPANPLPEHSMPEHSLPDNSSPASPSAAMPTAPSTVGTAIQPPALVTDGHPPLAPLPAGELSKTAPAGEAALPAQSAPNPALPSSNPHSAPTTAIAPQLTTEIPDTGILAAAAQPVKLAMAVDTRIASTRLDTGLSDPLLPSLAPSRFTVRAATPAPPNRSMAPVPPQPLQLAANTAVVSAAEESYTLGAGDRLHIEIFNVPEYSKDYQVLVNGTVNLHLVGNLAVQGLTLKQAEAAIMARYANLLQRPIVDVSLLAPRPLNVAIAGEIGRPGSYTVTAAEGTKFPTVTRLIQLAGGMSQSANSKRVIVRRPQASGQMQTINVDLWDLAQTGNLQQDLTLRDGDSIFIPAATEVDLASSVQMAATNFATDASQPLNVTLVGEVGRPGPHVLVRGVGEGKIPGGAPTVTQAIQQAGGITQMADIRRVEVRRSTRSGASQTIQLNLWDLLKQGDARQDLVLQQGDVITIATATALNPAEAKDLATLSFAPATIRINVVGEVVAPGAVQVPPNTPLNQGLLSAGGFTRRARKSSVDLIRLNPNGSVTRQSIAIDLSRGIDAKGNPALQNNDIIVVDRSGGAKLTDSLSGVTDILGRILPFGFLLR